MCISEFPPLGLEQGFLHPCAPGFAAGLVFDVPTAQSEILEIGTMQLETTPPGRVGAAVAAVAQAEALCG